MGSQSDRKTRKSPDAQRKDPVVEDEHGHQIWQGTIKTIKLSLMKTGIFLMSESQRLLMKLREPGTGDGGGFDPYDSTKK